jgi:hypothetical protein
MRLQAALMTDRRAAVVYNRTGERGEMMYESDS